MKQEQAHAQLEDAVQESIRGIVEQHQFQQSGAVIVSGGAEQTDRRLRAV